MFPEAIESSYDCDYGKDCVNDLSLLEQIA
jgi:hypothetical protein